MMLGNGTRDKDYSDLGVCSWLLGNDGTFHREGCRSNPF